MPKRGVVGAVRLAATLLPPNMLVYVAQRYAVVVTPDGHAARFYTRHHDNALNRDCGVARSAT
jgi:hypothetical protein